jgi:hypothetical protein
MRGPLHNCLISAIAAVMLVSCQPRHRVPAAPPAIDQKAAVSIAIKEAKARRGWAQVDVWNVIRKENSWRIVVASSPGYPEGFAFVEVAKEDGRILKWEPGL